MVTSDKLGTLKRRAAREGWARWIRTPADEHALLNGCYFDQAAADRVCEFFPRFLKHSKDPFRGKTFELDPWQRDDLISPLFGWKRASGVRRYTKAYCEIPKKNGKSTTAAGLGLYMLCGDGEGGAEVYSTANTKEQAGAVHNEAIAMVDVSEALKAELKINRSTKNISYPETNSFYRTLASRPDKNDGWNGHCCIVDELHKWHGRELWDTLRYMFRARSQPLLFVITTAGDDMLSVCREQHDYAQLILDGAHFDDRFFPLLYGAGADDNWLDPEVWKKANPSFGVAINADEFAADAAEAAKTPTGVASFKRYSLNVWATGQSPWLPAGAWAACQREFDPQELAGRKCWAGLDLSKTQDTTALVLAFPEDDERVLIVPRFYLPEETAREIEGRVPYVQWADQGLITLTPGNVCDYSFIEKDFLELAELYEIQEVRYDNKYAEELTQRIEAETGVARLDFPQNIMSFCGPTAEWERLVLSKKLVHNGHPVMAWQMGNAQVWTDANGNKRPTKPKPMDPRKIDGVVAGIMALQGVLEGNLAEEESVYEKRGFIYLDQL